jgi:hypothetical protein
MAVKLVVGNASPAEDRAATGKLPAPVAPPRITVSMLLARGAARLNDWAQATFSLDLRSLAALRVGLASMLLADLALRARDLVAHYTDIGVLPHRALQANTGLSAHLSVHAFSGATAIQILLFLVAASFAVLLLVGYRTRLATIVSLGLLISLQNRNPMILSGADQLLRVILCWSIFLPCGARFSLDSALRGRGPSPPKQVFHIGTSAYIIQLAIIYFFAALEKSGADWHANGTAVYYALGLSQFSTPLGQWLRSISELPRLLTFAVWWLEFIGPLLLFAPFWTTPVRLIVVAGFVGMQVGFGLVLANLGLFPVISIIVLLGLLPSWFWDRLVARAGLGAYAMRAALGAGLARVMAITTHFDRRIGSFVTNLPAAALRQCVSRNDAPARESNPPWQLNGFLRILAAICLLYVVLLNISILPGTMVRMPDRVAAAGRLVGLDQRWNMFSPSVPREGGWYVIPGTLGSGERVDLYRHGAELSWARPAHVAQTYRNDRWFKYLEAIRGWARGWLAPLYGEFLCSQWNAIHAGSERLEGLEVVYMVERTRSDYQRSAPRQQQVLQYQCAG